MRVRPWSWVLAPVLMGGALQAQEQQVGIRLGLSGEWGTIPGRVDYARAAGGTWGGSATLEVQHPAMPRLTFVTRVGYVPERSSPAAPQYTTLAGGVRLALWSMGRLTASTALEIERLYFSPAAYNEAVGAAAGWRFERDAYHWGWRGGMRVGAAVEFWPTGAIGYRVEPAIRWLGPVGEGGPGSNAAYATFGLGVLFRLRPLRNASPESPIR
jgi:hypothetical protein